MRCNFIQAGQSQSEASSECELERTEEEADVTVEGDEVEEDDDTTMSGFEADLSTVSPEVRHHSHERKHFQYYATRWFNF